eukprot:gb/GECG01007359.1/.p1 GENE.gb/GECG01007359.1/~~gb/GECG01007359.1/.p1  ORF type:complete len:127 (+),score=5.82 gb/GECG01007359.1/:1-381(+)
MQGHQHFELCEVQVNVSSPEHVLPFESALRSPRRSPLETSFGDLRLKNLSAEMKKVCPVTLVQALYIWQYRVRIPIVFAERTSDTFTYSIVPVSGLHSVLGIQARVKKEKRIRYIFVPCRLPMSQK